MPCPYYYGTRHLSVPGEPCPYGTDTYLCQVSRAPTEPDTYLCQVSRAPTLPLFVIPAKAGIQSRWLICNMNSNHKEHKEGTKDTKIGIVGARHAVPLLSVPGEDT